MDYNGMTEEEYLDSLLKQASDDIPNNEASEQNENSDESKPESIEEELDFGEAFDFDNIFNTLAEAEPAPAEGREDINDDISEVPEEFSDSNEEPIAADISIEDFFETESREMVSEDVQQEDVQQEDIQEDITEDSEFETDFLEAFLSQMESETPADSAEEIEPEGMGFDFGAVNTTDEEALNLDNFHESLDSIIGELEKDREDAETTDDFDIFSQIDNAEVSEEDLSQDIDDIALMEAVGMLLDEDEKKQGSRQASDDFDVFGDDLISDIPVKQTEEKTKKSFFKKFKAFLVEQGEDTDEDIAAAEAAELAKEEKRQQAEEEKEKKAEEKAAKKEKAEQDKAAKKAEKENKALERQMKKEQKKAEREASGEPKYNVTVIKLAFLFTIVAAFGILLWAISDFNYRRISKKDAMIYFTADQYELAYEEIAGLEPKKSEEVFFEQVRTVMYVQKQYDSYLNYYNIGMKEEALDALLKGIDKYDKYYENADDLGILEDMDNVLNKIYTALEETYNLSKEKADAIANIEDAADYSVELRKVINSIKE